MSDGQVEKVMSLSIEEFHKSITVLTGHPPQSTAASLVWLSEDGGRVEIGYAPLPGVTLGGLLALPRARVWIAFEGLDGDARAAFLRRFDLAFQRGGG